MEAKRIGPSAVVAGVVVDKVSFIVGVVCLTAILPASSHGFSASALILGLACTGLGAFVAARIAGRLQRRHGLWVAVVAFAISFARFIVFSVAPPDDPAAIHPLWWELIGWILIFPAGLLGGELAK